MEKIMAEDEQITSLEKSLKLKKKFKVKVFYKEACADVCVILSSSYVLQKKIFKWGKEWFMFPYCLVALLDS